MRHILPLAAALLAAGSLSAQVTTSGEATSGVVTKIKNGSKSDTDSVKKGTKFSRYASSYSSIRGTGYAYGRGHVWSSYDWRTRSRTYSASNYASGYLYSRSSSTDAQASTDDGNGKNEVMTFVFKASTATKGKLTVYVSAKASSKGAASAKVTIGSKSWAVKSGEKSKTASFDVTIDSKGTTVVIDAGGSAALKGSGRESYSGYGRVTFAPASSSGSKCTITKGVAGCGPELSGTASSSFFGTTVTLNLKKAAKNTLGLTLWSPDGKTVNVGKCPLFTNVLNLGVFKTSSTGTARHFIRAPRGKDLTIYVQDITLSFGSKGIGVTSSNTLKIACKK